MRSPDILPQWLLVVVGILGTAAAIWAGCIALQTLGAIRHEARIAVRALVQTRKFADAAQRSADASQSSADAAKLNADAIIKAERPWIFIGVRTDASGFNFDATNYGRTPAEIVSWSGTFTIEISHGDLRVPPTYTENMLLHRRFVAPEESWKAFYIFPMGLYSQDRDLRMDINRGEKKLIFLGNIKYLDMIGQTHETRFCFAYRPITDDLEVVGPEGYNQHT